MKTRLTQKLSSFGLKHYQIIFGNIFVRWLILFHVAVVSEWVSESSQTTKGEARRSQEKNKNIFFVWCRLQQPDNPRIMQFISFIFNMFFSHIIIAGRIVADIIRLPRVWCVGLSALSLSSSSSLPEYTQLFFLELYSPLVCACTLSMHL